MARTSGRSRASDTTPRATLTCGLRPPSTDPKFDQQIARLFDAIRAQSDWIHIVLERKQDLLLVWAQETRLIGSKDLHELVLDRSRLKVKIQEFVNEARRIAAYDLRIRLKVPLKVTAGDIIDCENLKQDITNHLKFIRGSKYALRQHPVSNNIGVWIANNIVPLSLQRELIEEMDLLSKEGPADTCPELGSSVQLLIDPSLYPYVAGKTPTVFEKNPTSFFVETVTWRHIFSTTHYSWIPSNFRISDDGLDVKATSYISGLGCREDHPILFHLIEKILLLCLPQLERVLASESEFVEGSSESVQRWIKRKNFRKGVLTESEWANLLADQARSREERQMAQRKVDETIMAEAREERANKEHHYFNLPDEVAASPTLKGQDINVVVKAFDICLGPGEEYDGFWEWQGLPYEYIKASAFYYYHIDNDISIDSDAGLGLRRLRSIRADFPSVEKDKHKDFHLCFKEPGDQIPGPSGEARHSDDVDPKNNFNDEDLYDDSNTDSDSDGGGEYHLRDYPSDWEEEVSSSGEKKPMSLDYMSPFIPVATIPISPREEESIGSGRLIAFPNFLQSKMGPIKNNAIPIRTSDECNCEKQIAKVRVIAFLFIDTDEDETRGRSHTIPGLRYKTIISSTVMNTEDVPSQVRACNFSTLHFILPWICRKLTGHNLPAELVDSIIGFGEHGITREEAEANRRRLLEERSMDFEKLASYESETFSLTPRPRFRFPAKGRWKSHHRQ